MFGFAGLSLGDDGPRLDPKLPAAWRELSFRIRWRGKVYALSTATAVASVPAEETPR